MPADHGNGLPQTGEPPEPSDPTAGVPTFITDADRQALAWIFDQVLNTRRAPTQHALLIHLRAPEQRLKRLQHLNLVAARGDRILPTRNGLRVVGGEAAQAHLCGLISILQSAKEIWLSTREPSISVERLAAACGLDVATTQQVLWLAPLTVEVDPESLMPTSCQLSDEILALDLRACAGIAWEHEPPRSEREFILRFMAGEKEFQSVEVMDRLNPREHDDFCDHHLRLDLSGLVIKGGWLCAASFQWSNLDGAVFENVVLNGSLFFECTLRGAVFRGVTVASTRFIACNLEGICVDDGGLPGANVEQSWFLTVTKGLRDRILAVSHWAWVHVGEEWVDRSWLDQPPRTAEGVSDGASSPSAGDRPLVVEVGPGTGTAGPTPAYPRLQLRSRPNSKMKNVEFDGEVIGEIDGGLVGARLIGLLLAHPDAEHHVLDLQSAVDDLVPTLYLGASDVDECRALIEQFGLPVNIPRELARDRRVRTGALLRRLDAVRREIEQRKERSKGWTAKAEATQLESVLQIEKYQPKSYGDGDDPIARAQNRLQRAYENVRGKLIDLHADLRAHLEASIRCGEFWVYETRTDT
jgi:uncharacterized protein YjbI with pentapeptide repeats